MNNILQIELILTQKCNLSCNYCYILNNENFDIDYDDMNLFKEIIPEILKLYQKNKYFINYFGGEPLLKWDMIKYINNELNCDKNYSGATLFTNGLLLDEEKFQYLIKNNINISLSFDGIWNDDNRSLISRESSLQHYNKKFELFKKYNLNSCSITVNPNNIETIVENFEFLYNFGIINQIYRFNEDLVWTNSDVKRFRIKLFELSKKYLKYNKENKKCNINLFNDTILKENILNNDPNFDFKNGHCFAGLNGLSFSHPGIFYPCARFINDNFFQLNNNKKINIELINKIKNIKQQKFIECNVCQIKSTCDCGCLYVELDKKNLTRKSNKHICLINNVIYNISRNMYTE